MRKNLKKALAKVATASRVKTLHQYMSSGNTNRPVGPMSLKQELDPGMYHICYDNSGLFFDRQSMKMDDLLRFNDPTHNKILNEVDDFWGKKGQYEKVGFLHNRALLMFGPPGSGKSCITKLAVESLTKNGDVIFMVDDVHNLIGGLKSFREVEPERRCLVIMEDIEEFSEHSLLQLLDGANTVDNILYLGTTNYIDRLPARVLRPGRFDRKIEVAFPPEAGRYAYLKQKLSDLDEDTIKYITDMTEGFSFGHMRELVTSVYCMDYDLENTLKRLSGDGLER